MDSDWFFVLQCVGMSGPRGEQLRDSSRQYAGLASHGKSSVYKPSSHDQSFTHYLSLYS